MNAEDNATDEPRRADDSSCTGVLAPAANDVSSIQVMMRVTSLHGDVGDDVIGPPGDVR